MRNVKIVATLGPATAGVERLQQMIEAGMDAARFNFSHGDADSHRRMFADLCEARARSGRFVAAIGDLCGPKIRLSTVKSGEAELKEDALVTLLGGDGPGDETCLYHSYAPLARDVRPGDPILIDDGRLRLSVLDIDGDAVRCRVEVGGTVRDRKGLNLPGSRLSTPALTEKDKQDLQLARELGMDYVALSFVRGPEDLLAVRRLAPELPVLAKIEKPEAVADLPAVLEAADGCMIARGDLGVELGHEKVPVVQKRTIAEIRALAKPVITATQMLDSMAVNPIPTRAEVSDVANAVLDGTDAVMLSAETSVGRYPVRTVRTMAAIIEEIEATGDMYRQPIHPVMRDRSFSGAIAEAVTRAAAEFDLRAVAVYTESGRSGALVSAHRPRASLIAFSRHDRVLNRLALYWGVKPLRGSWTEGVRGVVDQAEREMLAYDLVRPGDDIAVTFGLKLGDEPFQTNMMKLWKVREASAESLEREE